jgi:large subunit ribosomal protein L29
MKAKDIRQMTREELVQKLEDDREEAFKLRAQKAVAQLDKCHRVKQIRRDIARVTTILKDGGYSHK